VGQGEEVPSWERGEWRGERRTVVKGRGGRRRRWEKCWCMLLSMVMVLLSSLIVSVSSISTPLSRLHRSSSARVTKPRSMSTRVRPLQRSISARVKPVRPGEERPGWRKELRHNRSGCMRLRTFTYICASVTCSYHTIDDNKRKGNFEMLL
jgi:hypothetical protein